MAMSERVSGGTRAAISGVGYATPARLVSTQEIEARIAAGDLADGDPLPPERDLIESFGVSLGEQPPVRCASIRGRAPRN